MIVGMFSVLDRLVFLPMASQTQPIYLYVHMADVIAQYAEFYSVNPVIATDGMDYGMVLDVFNNNKDKCLHMSTIPREDKIEVLINKKNPGDFKTIKLYLKTFCPVMAKRLLDRMENA